MDSRKTHEDAWTSLVERTQQKNSKLIEKVGLTLTVPYSPDHIVGLHNGLNNGNVAMIE